MKAQIFNLKDHPLYNQIFLFFLCALPMSLPFPMKINNILIVSTLVIWIAGGGFSEKFSKLKRSPLFFLFISLFLIQIIGLPRNNYVNNSWTPIERSLSLLLLPMILFSSGPFTKKHFNNILKFFILGCLSSMIFCFIYAIYKHTQIDYDFEWNIFTVELNHVVDVSHVYFGMYLSFASFAAVYIFIDEKNKYSLLSLILFIATSILFMLAITSKIAFLGLLLIGLFIGSLTIDIRKNILKIAIGGVASFIFIFLIFKNVKHVERRFKEGFNYSLDSIANDKYNYSSTRMGPLKCALILAKEHWLLGVGTGDQEYMMGNCYMQNNLDQLIEFNAHNQYLDYLISHGITGLLLFVICLTIPLYLAFRKRNYLYVSFLLLFLLCNCTENILHRNKGIVFFAFFNSFLAVHMISGYKKEVE